MTDKKKKISTRLKKYFTEKPKSSFWMWAFITLFFFKWFTPTVLRFYLMFQLGLVAPEADFTSTMEKTSQNLAESFMSMMQRMFELGQNIAIQNPLTAKIIFYGFSYLIYAFWIAMFLLVLNLFRYGISWIYRKYNSPKGIVRRYKLNGNEKKETWKTEASRARARRGT